MRPSLARKCRKAAQDRQRNAAMSYNQETEVPVRQGGVKR
jgi:hypothetical protein